MSQRNAIGVDIGGTKILAATVDETGSVLEQIVQDNGGTVLDRVTKGLTYLVMADPDSESTKARKAREYGTECIDLATLEGIIKKNGGVVPDDE